MRGLSILAEEQLGAIYLRMDMQGLDARLYRYLNIVGIIVAASMQVAVIFSSKLQRGISEPMLRLAATARSVTLEKNYSVRAEVRGRDEIGRLVDAFNGMLGVIERRDVELQEAQESLKMRVAVDMLEAEEFDLVLMDLQTPLDTARPNRSTDPPA